MPINLLNQLRETLYGHRRRAMLWFNRQRFGFGVRRRSRFFQVVVPDRHQKKVRYLKYFFAGVGLLSAFVVFQSVWYAFGFSLGLFFISLLLERTIFAHPAMFLHALPATGLDPDKWFGVSFGYARPPGGPVDIPLVGMMVADVDYAKKLERLFLSWTNGEYEDEKKNLRISVVVTGPREYIFLCHPSLKRPVAKRFFDGARKELRQTSLEDLIIECHGMIVLGKRCRLSPDSYFPEFRRRYSSGTPVMFGFYIPPFDEVRLCPGVSTFIIFDFSIKEKSALTRRDFEYDAIGDFEVGGKWQGPTEQM
jgi:hypothetical protein